ncbi:hypothetical protein FIBSPDRAFT_825792 [Athelia psychrophila]|uniref:Uncharacterized protein n=1 Tax=Athelia psychrophila TaxID=1759441 RepID=A0A166JVY6_9AGAM|nr:hypothetical protein FIBSPDRAFT_825792 [Fibularhizoctonia sp. CBS 109695]
MPDHLPRGSSNRIHSLPAVDIHHRHCAVQLYFPVERVERLTHPEKRVAPPRTTPTNNLAFNQTAQDRVHRAGDAMLAPSSSGGLWGDRPRCMEAIEETAIELKYRPRIHPGIVVNGGWEIVDQQCVISTLQSYKLPHAILSRCRRRCAASPPSSICFWGPYRKQTRTEILMFKAHRMCMLFPQMHWLAFNTPRAARSLVPSPTRDFTTQACASAPSYPAVAPFPSRLHSPNIGTKLDRRLTACIHLVLVTRQGR